MYDWCTKMSGRTLIQVEKPTTQTIAAVKSLLAYVGRASDPLPIFVELKGSVRLTRSKRGDCYYTTTPADCSCKARSFNPGTPCKHMKALQAGNSVEASRAQARAYQARQRELREQAKSSSSPAEAAQPARRLARPEAFRPVDTLPSEEKAAKASSSFCMVDTTPDATPREIAYQEMKMVRDMWPVEA